jgi:F-type H+-transporting ATPase subunit epsilon
MFDKPFKLEIVTPQRILFSGNVTSFEGPGIAGSFETLANHVSFLTAIKVGRISFRKETDGDKRTHMATSGGFVEVLKNQVTIVAETAEFANEIDTQRAEESKKRAEQRLSEKKVEIDIARAEAALTRAINRLKIAQMME